MFAALGGLLGGWIDDRLGSRNALFLSIGGTTLFFALVYHGARIGCSGSGLRSARAVVPLPFVSPGPRSLHDLCSAT